MEDSRFFLPVGHTYSVWYHLRCEAWLSLESRKEKQKRVDFLVIPSRFGAVRQAGLLTLPIVSLHELDSVRDPELIVNTG